MAFQITTFAHGGNSSAALSATTGVFNAVAGNLLVVAVSVFNPNGTGLPPTISDTALNTYTLIGSSPVSPSGLNGLTNIWFYYSNNITGNAVNAVKVTWAASINESFVQILAYQISGAVSGNPVNTFQIGGGASASNAQSTAALTTTAANTIVLAYGSLTNTGATYTAGSGYTLDLGSAVGPAVPADDGGLSGCEHQQFSSIQTGIIPAITATDSTHKWQMMAVAIAGPNTTFSISGNAGVAGATVSWSGTSSGSTTADGSGNYTIPSLVNGSYTITPTLTGYSFSPTNSNQTVSGANITGVNFVATQTQVATPTFSPVAGTYAGAQSVSISSTDSGLSGFAITYTTDGTTPIPGSHGTVYSGPVAVSSSLTLKAVASATSFANSNVGSAAYTITGGSVAYSVPDCRVSPFGPNSSRTVQGTKIYDVQTSDNSTVPSVDSRAAGAPVDSRVASIIPQNSRTPGTFGPGQ